MTKRQAAPEREREREPCYTICGERREGRREGEERRHSHQPHTPRSIITPGPLLPHYTYRYYIYKRLLYHSLYTPFVSYPTAVMSRKANIAETSAAIRAMELKVIEHVRNLNDIPKIKEVPYPA